MRIKEVRRCVYIVEKVFFGGIAIGTIQVYKKGEQQVKRRKIEDVPAEIRRYRTAKQTALEQLQNLYDKALKEVGEAMRQFLKSIR